MKYGFDKNAPLEIGVYSLGENMPHPKTGDLPSAKQRIRNIIEFAKAADELGLDSFSLGESHQEHFISQAHAVILAAIAEATNKIKIASGSTIISTSDPVRVYENFSTLDAISDGRAEIVAGRGSRIGLFELLGYDINNYEELYEENLDLLRKINENDRVTWEGQFRAPLNNVEVLPRAERELPLFRAVGGPTASVLEAARAGIPIVQAQLAGHLDTYKKSIDIYRSIADDNGHNSEELPIITGGFMYIGEDIDKAIQEFWPHADNGFRLANGKGFNKRAIFQGKSIESVLNVGDKDFIIEKLHYQYEMYGMQRYIAELDFGGVPHNKQMEMLEILGTYIAPKIKELTSK